MFVNINLLLFEQGGGPGEEKVGAEVEEDNLNLHTTARDHITCSLVRGSRTTASAYTESASLGGVVEICRFDIITQIKFAMHDMLGQNNVFQKIYLKEIIINNHPPSRAELLHFRYFVSFHLSLS